MVAGRKIPVFRVKNMLAWLHGAGLVLVTGRTRTEYSVLGRRPVMFSSRLLSNAALLTVSPTWSVRVTSTSYLQPKHYHFML